MILSDIINESTFISLNNGTASEGVPQHTQHGGLLPDYEVTRHVNYLIILVCASFCGQVIHVMLNRQLFIKTPCNPGFTLEEGFKLSRHMGNLPQLFMDTAKLPQIKNVLEQDVPLIGSAVNSSFTAVYCGVMLATSLGLLFTINTTSACALA